MGITTKSMDKKNYPPVEPKPFNKERMFMPYAEAVEDSRRHKENQLKVNAYKKALEEGKDPADLDILKPKDQIVAEVPVTTAEELPKQPKAEVPFVKRGKRAKKV